MSLLTESDYDFIARLVYDHSRINLGANKRELVAARVGKRLRALKIPNYGDYCDLLRSRNGPEELGNLVDVISTNHTLFFREAKHFEILKSRVLPEWCGELRKHRETCLNVWSAASSSGEEPYTLAIVLAEYFVNEPTLTWQIQATDISTRILEKARQGVYAAERLQSMSPEQIRKHFQKGVGHWSGHYRVKDELRKRVQFHHLNLLQPQYPFTHRFHVVFCRNVMIYFDRPTQQVLVEKLSHQMHPGGYLMVGHSESLTGIDHGLKPVQPATYLKP